MKTKPTYDELMTALYMILEFTFSNDDIEEKRKKLVAIRDICKHVLPV